MTAAKVSEYRLEIPRNHGSPSRLMYTDLGNRNMTVDTLAVFLVQAGLIRAAEVLRGLGWFFTVDVY